jgi:hypothetical protein
MAKNDQSRSAQRKGPAKRADMLKSAVAVARDSASGKFVLGRSAFSRISAVEGVYASKSLKADLRSLEDSSYDKRRSVLSSKYGKRK